MATFKQRDPKPKRRPSLTSRLWLVTFLFVGVSTLLLAHHAKAQLNYFPLTPPPSSRIPAGRFT